MSFFDNCSGKPEDAFAKPFVDIIPNGTTAIAQITEVKIIQSMGNECYQIDWKLISGQFEGNFIFQKLHVFDKKTEKALKARNMLKLIMDLFHLNLVHNNPPSEQELKRLIGKSAGLKIAEWQMPRDDGSIGHGNNVAEVHPAAGFTTATGSYREFKESAPKGAESALTRNANKEFNHGLDDNVPF